MKLCHINCSGPGFFETHCNKYYVDNPKTTRLIGFYCFNNVLQQLSPAINKDTKIASYLLPLFDQIHAVGVWWVSAGSAAIWIHPPNQSADENLLQLYLRTSASSALCSKQAYAVGIIKQVVQTPRTRTGCCDSKLSVHCTVLPVAWRISLTHTYICRDLYITFLLIK